MSRLIFFNSLQSISKKTILLDTFIGLGLKHFSSPRKFFFYFPNLLISVISSQLLANTQTFMTEYFEWAFDDIQIHLVYKNNWVFWRYLNIIKNKFENTSITKFQNPHITIELKNKITWIDVFCNLQINKKWTN